MEKMLFSNTSIYIKLNGGLQMSSKKKILVSALSLSLLTVPTVSF